MLSVIITASGKLGRKIVPAKPDPQTSILYSVGGITRRKDPRRVLQIDWKSLSALEVGDTVEIKVLETTEVDKSTRRRKPAKSP